MDDRQQFKRMVLWVLVGFLVLLYLLGALSLWARHRFLREIPALPALARIETAGPNICKCVLTKDAFGV